MRLVFLTDSATAAQGWRDELNEIHTKWPNASIVIGEAGYCLNIQVSDATQSTVLQAEYAAIEQMNPPWLKGWNYWVGAGGPGHGGYTNILKGSTGNWTVRAAGSELSSLAERMVNTTDAVEAARVRETIIRGFYGQRHDA